MGGRRSGMSRGYVTKSLRGPPPPQSLNGWALHGALRRGASSPHIVHAHPVCIRLDEGCGFAHCSGFENDREMVCDEHRSEKRDLRTQPSIIDPFSDRAIEQRS